MEQSSANNADRPVAREKNRRTSGPPRMVRRSRGGAGRGRGPRQCPLCVSRMSGIDYKQADILQSYVTEQGKIKPRRQTGLCAKHQRRVARSIKRARHLALLPFTAARQGRFAG